MEKVGKIAKYTVLVILFTLIGLFILRCCFAADHSVLSKLLPTAELREIYAREGKDMELLTHPVVREISKDGYMACYAFVWSPGSREVQVTIRYNDSVYRYNSLPEGTEFTFTLTDTDTELSVPGIKAAEEKRLMYHYIRLIFSGVTITDTNDLVLRMFAGDEEISSDTIHYHDQNLVIEPYKLSRKEKEALSGN